MKPTFTQQELDWLAKQPKLLFEDVVDEMNVRFVGYIKGGLVHRLIDKQVRQDFAFMGAQDKGIVLNESDTYVRK